MSAFQPSASHLLLDPFALDVPSLITTLRFRLLPEILDNIFHFLLLSSSPSTLATLCQLSKSTYTQVAPRLYSTCTIRWTGESSQKIVFGLDDLGVGKDPPRPGVETRIEEPLSTTTTTTTNNTPQQGDSEIPAFFGISSFRRKALLYNYITSITIDDFGGALGLARALYIWEYEHGRRPFWAPKPSWLRKRLFSNLVKVSFGQKFLERYVHLDRLVRSPTNTPTPTRTNTDDTLAGATATAIATKEERANMRFLRNLFFGGANNTQIVPGNPAFVFDDMDGGDDLLGVGVGVDGGREVEKLISAKDLCFHYPGWISPQSTEWGSFSETVYDIIASFALPPVRSSAPAIANNNHATNININDNNNHNTSQGFVSCDSTHEGRTVTLHNVSFEDISLPAIHRQHQPLSKLRTFFAPIEEQYDLYDLVSRLGPCPAIGRGKESVVISRDMRKERLEMIRDQLSLYHAGEDMVRQTVIAGDQDQQDGQVGAVVDTTGNGGVQVAQAELVETTTQEVVGTQSSGQVDDGGRYATEIEYIDLCTTIPLFEDREIDIQAFVRSTIVDPHMWKKAEEKIRFLTKGGDVEKCVCCGEK
nr:uncharacterized protein CI109_003832 [Kwoniella shandongensis]KAA5527860.1 hypothetical protein CI109_003832 [Kwoniella shandongensis]